MGSTEVTSQKISNGGVCFSPMAEAEEPELCSSLDVEARKELNDSKFFNRIKFS